IVLGIVALIFLGPKRIPEAARSLGHAFRELKGSIGDHHDAEATEALNASTPIETPPPAANAPGPEPAVSTREERRTPVGAE
ncbi:MAG TPA: twin-arginine translocase TatA/TatE family subunit, partial [Solirubrobacteraceae bacterium]